MNILEGTQYIITIPTDSEELANLLDKYAGDWPAVLEFIDSVSTAQGVIINQREVAELMRKMYE